MPEKSEEPLDVTEHFNEDRAEIYDDLIRQAIPGYEAPLFGGWIAWKACA